MTYLSGPIRIKGFRWFLALRCGLAGTNYGEYQIGDVQARSCCVSTASSDAAIGAAPLPATSMRMPQSCNTFIGAPSAVTIAG